MVGAMAVDPAATTPRSRSGPTYWPPRLHENVTDFISAAPDSRELLISRICTLEPSQPGEGVAFHCISLPSPQFTAEAQSWTCCASTGRATGAANRAQASD